MKLYRKVGNWLKENWFKLGLLIALFLVGGSVIYVSTQEKRQDQIKQSQPSTDIISLPSQSPISDTALEIEKCKVGKENIDSRDLDAIVATVNQIFQPKFKNLEGRYEGIISLCIDEATRSNLSREGVELCQKQLDEKTKEKEAFSREQTGMFSDLIEQTKQGNYERCLDLIE